MIKVYIDGREGTTGLRIDERLNPREDIELLQIDPALRKDDAERKRLLNQADIAFLCLPDAAAIQAAQMVENPTTILIDASTAHRTSADWAYGLPELSHEHRSRIASGKRIAVPGCHASGFIALCYPLIQAGVLPKDYPHACHSLTGYSGGGKSMIAQYEQPENRDTEFDSPRQYGLSQQHKHLKEMVSITGISEPPLFMPIVADFYSGMEVTVPLHTRLLNGKISKESIHALLQKHYEGQKLVRVLPLSDESFLPANALTGRDSMQIQVFGNDERVLITARYDNLGKGASGAAVQCMNIALGLDEEKSLVI